MSEQINDGGPAFPCGPFGDTMHGEDGREWYQHDRLPGMTLRDYFAGQVLAGLSHWRSLTEIEKQQEAAANCYDMADAMLAERSKVR